MLIFADARTTLRFALKETPDYRYIKFRTSCYQNDAYNPVRIPKMMIAPAMNPGVTQKL